MRQVGEPTVEEILDSIKKVIARDNRAGAARERRQRETDGVTAAEDAAGDDVLDLTESVEFIEAGIEKPEEDEPDEDEDAPLINEGLQASMRDSLAALALLSEPGVQPQIVRSGETSLEGLARELLRPALAEWLDKNLPPLVERMVATEIARIVGKRG